MSITSTAPTPPFNAVSLRQDAGVIGLVGLAHMISHFSQLLLAPLFPWLKEEFSVSYAELGFLMTIFFVVSCAVQALSGFVVDRFGPRPILFAGLSLLGLAAFGYAVSTSYWMMAAFAVLAVLVLHRDKLTIRIVPPVQGAPVVDSSLGFLKIPAVWMCFAFFFWYAIVLSVVQAFAPEAARQLHKVPLGLVAMCLTIYMVCSAGGMVLGGFLASDPARCERVVGAGFGLAAVVALVLALGSFPAWMVPVLFGVMGFASGIAGPSRDLLVKRSTPDNASGRVYGVVYAGLDIGQAISPLIFGVMMDHGQYRGVLLGLALMQGVLIASAFNVRRVRRTALAPAPGTVAG